MDEITPEQWRDIPGWPGYQASNMGRVRSSRSSRSSSSPRVRKAAVATNGFRMLSLRRDGKAYQKTVHSLVLLAFIGPRPDVLETRHLNGDALDNRLSNLKYGTHDENMQDCLRHGTHSQASKMQCVNGHPFDGINSRVEVDSSGQFRQRRCKPCHQEACRRYREREA